jgi:hypothetical protein
MANIWGGIVSIIIKNTNILHTIRPIPKIQIFCHPLQEGTSKNSFFDRPKSTKIDFSRIWLILVDFG